MDEAQETGVTSVSRCGHCKNLVPEWTKLAAGFKGLVNVGAVDMTVHGTVGEPYDVSGFPTIKVCVYVCVVCVCRSVVCVFVGVCVCMCVRARLSHSQQ